MQAPSAGRLSAACRAALLVLPALGCGGGAPSHDAAPDGAVDGGDAGSGFEVAPPAPPALTPCPLGWREVQLEPGVPGCEPWPEAGAEDCSTGLAHFPGEAGCAAVGPSCPGGDWPEGLPTDGTRVVYASAGAEGGGDGTRERPFATVAEALAAAGSGDVVALSRGTFDEAVVLGAGETLWGACAAETTISSSVPSGSAGVVTVAGEGARLRGLRVTGARGGLWVSGPCSVEVEGVIVEGVERLGVLVRDRATASLRDVAIRDVRPVAGSGIEGRGLAVETGAGVSFARGLVDRAHMVGVSLVGAGASLEMEGVAIRRTLSSAADRRRGIGLYLEGGPRVEGSAVVVEECRMAGIYANGASTALSLEASVVRDVLAQESDGEMGTGVQLQDGVEADLRQVVVQRATGGGIAVVTEGTTLDAMDLVVLDTAPAEADGLWGYGLVAQDGAVVEVERGLVARAHQTGVCSSRHGALVRLVDVEVRETLSVPGGSTPGLRGRGLEAILGGRLEVLRGLVAGNREVAVAAIGEGVELLLEDVAIADTAAAACEETICAGRGGGIGLGAYSEAHVRATRFLVTRAERVGLQLAHGSGGGGTMDLSEGEVSHCPIGANVQTEGFDVARLTDRVRFVDNGRDLDSVELPVPGVESPFGR